MVNGTGLFGIAKYAIGGLASPSVTPKSQPDMSGLSMSEDVINPDPLLTTKQAGRYLGFSDEYVRQKIATGVIDIVCLGPREAARPRIRVRRSALEAFVAAHVLRGPAAAARISTGTRASNPSDKPGARPPATSASVEAGPRTPASTENPPTSDHGVG